MNLEYFTFIDYILILFIFTSSLYGFYRGFFRSFVSFLGWVAAIVLTYKFFPSFEALLSDYTSSKTITIIVGNSILFCAILLCFALINSMIYTLFSHLNKSIVNRIMGLVFGMLRGILIISLLFFSYSVSLKLIIPKKEPLNKDDYHDFITNAYLFEILETTNSHIEKNLPSSLHNHIFTSNKTDSSTLKNHKLVKLYIEKLSFYLSKEQANHLNYKRQAMISIESEESIDLMTLRALYDNYNEQLNKNPQLLLTSDEINDIELLLKNKN